MKTTRTYTQVEIDAHWYEMREAFEGGLISRAEYNGQMSLMEEAERKMREQQQTTRPVTQEWAHSLPMMQQTVLLTAVRGPDGLPKYGSVKMLLRWFRRCTLLSAMDGQVLTNPYDTNGGSFTGPSLPNLFPAWENPMNDIVSEYLRTLDAIPHHFQLHFMHAAEIVGYKHPDERIRDWWYGVYLRLVNDMHLHPESEQEMDERLGDNRDDWLRRADHATAA